MIITVHLNDVAAALNDDASYTDVTDLLDLDRLAARVDVDVHAVLDAGSLV